MFESTSSKIKTFGLAIIVSPVVLSVILSLLRSTNFAHHDRQSSCDHSGCSATTES